MEGSGSHTRQLVYALLIVTALGNMLGRVASVQSKTGNTPFLSANDRSRWCTVRSLVDLGTYQIDGVLFRGGKRDPEWYSIDVVKHRGGDGREHFYSSKPTLFPTLLAAEYWAIKNLTGATLERKPLYVGRIMLILTNVLSLAFYFGLLVRIFERHCKSEWSRMFGLTVATWGTLITTYAASINNHTIAAVSALVACDLAWRILRSEKSSWGWFMLSGLSAAFTAVNELPALSLFALLAIGHAIRNWRKTLLGFVPGSAVIFAASSYTGYLAHGTWLPAYSQRGDGPKIAVLAPSGRPVLDQSKAPDDLGPAIERTSTDGLVVTVVSPGKRWTVFDPQTQLRYTAVAEPDVIELRESRNWYEYEGSYWLDGVKKGVDRGEPSIAKYAFHALIGHHGVFSLTPVWFIAIAGAMISMQARDELAPIVVVTVATTLICLGFFLFRPMIDRNYGGVSCGFRWMIWMTPLWIVCAIPALDRFGESRVFRWLAVGLLLVSVFSASVPGDNPWTHPWIYRYLEFVGYLRT